MIRLRTPRAPSHRHAERRYYRAALVTLAVIVAATYLAFTKQLPFGSSFQLRGVFSSANQLQSGSLVRVAGIDIGKVESITAGPDNTSVVSMEIDNPSELHTNASLAIRPRLFFEGNFYIDVNPGTPAAPTMQSGATVPLGRTSVPVQLDQLLDVFTAPIRASLQSSTAQLATGLGAAAGAPPSGAGSQGLRNSAHQLSDALDSITDVSVALQGTQAGDLDHAIDSSDDTTTQLAENPAALMAFVTNYNGVFAALSANDQALASSVRDLDGLLRTAPAQLTQIDAALPSLTSFAGALRPALADAPPTLTKLTGLFHQVGALTSPPELPALLTRLSPVTASLPTLERHLNTLFPEVSAVTGCVAGHVIPALNMTVPDGALSTGQPVWLELLHLAASLAGTSPNFDGNGTTIRLGITEGASALTGVIPGLGPVVETGQLDGLDPTALPYGTLPAFRPDQPCTAQAPPSLASRAAGAPDDLHPTSVSPATPAVKALTANLLSGPTALPKLLDELAPGSSPMAPASSAGSSPAQSKPVSGGVPASTRPTPATSAPTPATSGKPTGGSGATGATGAPTIPVVSPLLNQLLGSLLHPNSPPVEH